MRICRYDLGKYAEMQRYAEMPHVLACGTLAAEIIRDRILKGRFEF
jgi:hypothetical protein